MIGRRFGRLTVGAEVRVGERRRLAYQCACDCGESRVVLKENLTSGRQVSCGCHNREMAKKVGNHTRKHGMWKSRTYGIWRTMKNRCLSPNSGAFHRYGALGVQVCDRWLEFTNFLADMGECPDGLTLDRINPFGNYEPGNCRWATWKEQANNKRTHHQAST